MTPLQQVLWTRGVLLAPQHLQAHDRFLEDCLRFTLSTLTAFRWGFRRLDIDEDSVAAGELRIRSASGVFLDGLLFDFPAADHVPSPKPIRDGWNPDQSALLIYLAVPKYREGGRNIADGVAAGTRYVVDTISRRDENTGEEEKRIEIARKNLRLLTGNESRDGYSSLPVARILRARSGAMQIDPDYVPPLLDFTASTYLTSATQGLLARLAGRSNDLSALRRQRNRSLAEFGNSDAATFWLLYTVNSHLPRLRHMLETRGGHPAQLFDAMSSLAGSLTTFSTDIVPEGLATYSHDDPGGAFAALVRDIYMLLDTVLPSRSVSLPLALSDEGGMRTYSVSLNDDRYLAAEELYVAVHTEMHDADLLDHAPALKVSSREHVRELVQQSKRGLSLVHVGSPPTTVAVKPTYRYFRVAPDGESWEKVRKSRSLALHAPKGFENAGFELVIVLADH